MLFFRYVESGVICSRFLASQRGCAFHYRIVAFSEERNCSLNTKCMLTSIARSFFKTLVDSEITVELKNEVCIRGTLKSVDQYLNIKLDNAEATDELRWPHLVRYIFASRLETVESCPIHRWT